MQRRRRAANPPAGPSAGAQGVDSGRDLIGDSLSDDRVVAASEGFNDAAAIA